MYDLILKCFAFNEHHQDFAKAGLKQMTFQQSYLAYPATIARNHGNSSFRNTILFSDIFRM